MDAQARVPLFNLRFGLKGLIFLMAAVAVGAAAFRDASRPWMTICTSAALISIFFAVIAAAYGRCDRQAFWTGFAIFAGAYFLFVVRFANSDILANLATTNAINFVSDKVHPLLGSGSDLPEPAAALRVPPAAATTMQQVKFALTAFSVLSFSQVTVCYPNLRVGDDTSYGSYLNDELPIIGHCQCTLLLGWLGGLLAHGIAVRMLETKDALSRNYRIAKKGRFDDAA
jgi:hypothetical protein